MNRCQPPILPFALMMSVVLTTGCGFNTQTPAGPSTTSLHLKGSVHGGNQPVSGASIQLFAAGTNGYGTGAVSLLTNPVTTDAGGSFTITGDYTCPAGASQLYLTATGGNPGLAAGTNNPAIQFMAALGSCNAQLTLDPNLFIGLNEVTTVTAAYALSGFFAPDASQIGTSSTNATGLANAFATSANLADLTSGTALAQTPAQNGTVPQTTINAVANMLSACVNSNGSGTPCSALFTAATPPNGTAPANTLKAAVDIAHNPANNVVSLFNLASATPPFQPTLTTAPNDWTLTVTFHTTANQTSAALDAEGNLWVGNENTSPLNPQPSLYEFSNQGVLLSGTAGYTGGGIQNEGPNAIAIDPRGNVFTNDIGGVLSEFSQSGTPLSPSNGFPHYLAGLAIDGNGNLWGGGASASSTSSTMG